MGELLLLVLVLSVAALGIAWPLLDRGAVAPVPADGGADEAEEVRRRLALEALRDLEADRRAGSLGEGEYALQRAEAEARAAEALAQAAQPAPSPASGAQPGRGRATAAGLGAALAGLVLIGFVLPAPIGVAERTVTDRGLAEAVAAEEARQAVITGLLDRLAADPTDPDLLSDLADAYLAGGSAEDLQRGARTLLLLLAVQPEDGSAYRRLVTAYISAGDWPDASSALDAYAAIAGSDEPDIPFFRGIIALRGDDDPAEAVRQFDAFLEVAPHDPRAGMVITLREQAAGRAGGT